MMNPPLVPLRRAASLALTLSLALSAALIAACGGGGDTPAVAGASQATAYAAGPISGFGSVIVNGVRFSDDSASVSDDDDNSRGRSELKLGMMVEVDGQGLDHAAGSARALRIRFGSEIVGPINRIDSAGNSLVVLGQTVEIKPTTVFDDSITGGLAGLVDRTLFCLGSGARHSARRPGGHRPRRRPHSLPVGRDQPACPAESASQAAGSNGGHHGAGARSRHGQRRCQNHDEMTQAAPTESGPIRIML